MVIGVDMSHVHDDGRWANQGSWEGYSYYADNRFWEDVARICERGGIDFVFFGDDASTPDTYGGDFAEAVRWGIRWPRHDMLTTVPLMARATRNLGFALTMSTSYAQVLIAAAQSGRGMQFVAEHAEFQFAARQSVERMRSHWTALNEALTAAGRSPDDVGVIWGTSVWLGKDKDDAIRRRRRVIDAMAPNTGRVHLYTQLGYDLANVPDDTPLLALADEIGVAQGMLGMFEELLSAEGQSPSMSIDQIGREMLADSGLKVLGSPRDIAGQLIEIHEAVPGRNGFMLHGFHTMPRDLEQVASEVMPVLRAEGYAEPLATEPRTLRQMLSSHLPPTRNTLSLLPRA